MQVKKLVLEPSQLGKFAVRANQSKRRLQTGEEKVGQMKPDKPQS